MKAKKSKVVECDLKSTVRKIKDEFRRWYGMISVRELAANKILTHEIEVMEKLILQMGGAR